MREIKFRGKRVDTGEWVHGVPVVTTISGVYMVSTKRQSKGGRGGIVVRDVVVQHEVDPSTIGQYTGLKDKKGREIYEGDLLEVVSELMTNYGRTPTGKFGKTLSMVKWLEEGAWGTKVLESNTTVKGYVNRQLAITAKYAEVIGNIHDSPELLGARE